MRVLIVTALTALAFAASAQASSTPPVIHESFTVLPCPKHATSTIAIEGCQEHALIVSNRRIDALARRIFAHLLPRFREWFVRAETSWLAYRRASCTTEASPSFGGTANGIEFLGCEIGRNASHLADLRQVMQALLVH